MILSEVRCIRPSGPTDAKAEKKDGEESLSALLRASESRRAQLVKRSPRLLQSFKESSSRLLKFEKDAMPQYWIPSASKETVRSVAEHRVIAAMT